MGQRTPQTIGEELLDYRNYWKWKLRLTVVPMAGCVQSLVIVDR